MGEFLQLAQGLGPIGLALVAAWLAYRHNKLTRELNNDNLQKQLFSELNKRYDALNDVLQFAGRFSEEENQRFLTASDEEKFGDFTKAQITFKINDYFNLCSEEYYWYSKKRIDKRIWDSWKKGMDRIYSESLIIQKQWQEEIQDGGWKSFYLDKPDRLFS